MGKEVMDLWCWPVSCESVDQGNIWPLSSSSHQCSCYGDNVETFLLISPSHLGRLAYFRKLICVSWSSCEFASLLIYESRLSVLSGAFMSMVSSGVSVWPCSTYCWDSSQFLILLHFPWGAGRFVPEVISLVPQFEFPWLHDILSLWFMLTL